MNIHQAVAIEALVTDVVKTRGAAGREWSGIRLEEKLAIFMEEYKAYLINWLEVGKDGQIAHERRRGKRSTVNGDRIW